MLKLITASVGFASLIFLASGGARALPVAGPVASDATITLAADGCGPNGHRDRFGRCEQNRPRPRYEERRRYDERRYEEPRRVEPRCVVRMTPMGPQRFCD